MFCNLQEKCISDNGQCTDFNTAENQINEETLKAIYTEFDDTYGAKEDELRSRIDEILELNIIRLRYLKRLHEAQFFMYNKQKNKIGDSIRDELDEDGNEDTCIDRYYYLFHAVYRHGRCSACQSVY